jgi:FAD/FMN-containing dehydrogenase
VHRGHPDLIVFPAMTDEAAAIVGVANEHRVRLLVGEVT